MRSHRMLPAAILGASLLLLASSASPAVQSSFDANNPRGSVNFGLQRKPKAEAWPATPIVPVRGPGEVIGTSERSGQSVRVTRADYIITATADFFQSTDVGKDIAIGPQTWPIATVKDARHVVIGAVTLGTITTPTAFTLRTDRVKMVDETVTPGEWTYRAFAYVGSDVSGFTNEIEVTVGPNDPSGQVIAIDLGGLGNISTRARLGQGEATMIAGFSILPGSRERVLIRAAGPALAHWGIADPVQRPQLRVIADGRELARNAGWADAPELAAAAAAAGAFAFDPGSADAALLLDLGPGTYTAIVETPPGQPSGTALAEVYRVLN